tara:strand:- start:44 stop:244 length:201 start_codon:yes stop_codon:yes gene_type:complete
LYNIIVTENKKYTVDGAEKTYPTVVEVKSLKVYSEEDTLVPKYDILNLHKIYIDGVFYDKAEDVPE